MRLIVILIALAAIGMLVSRQLGTGSSTGTPSIKDQSAVVKPKIPVTPGEVQNFDGQLDSFIQGSKAKIDEEIEKQMK